MAQSDRGIVTPEAVLLEFQTAAVGSRTVGIVLDLLVMAAALTAVLMVLGAAAAGGLPEVASTIFIVVALFGILFGYPIVSETVWSGRTLGKAAMGLRVVTREGAPVRFRHAAIRGASALVDFYLFAGAVAVATSLLTRDNQRLGDLAAGTIVLRERAARTNASSMTFPVPPGWQPYVASLDVSAVTTEQYGVIRDLLLRVRELSDAARWHLSVRMAGPVATAMHHQPPAGVAPESFLVCVAAAYQQRHVRAAGVVPSGPAIGGGPPPPQGVPVSTVPPPPPVGTRPPPSVGAPAPRGPETPPGGPFVPPG